MNPGQRRRASLARPARRRALRHDTPLTVADGYHRICARYHLDENADIPDRIVDLPPVEAGERPEVKVKAPGRAVRGEKPID